jgi:hypothetical protein
MEEITVGMEIVQLPEEVVGEQRATSRIESIDMSDMTASERELASQATAVTRTVFAAVAEEPLPRPPAPPAPAPAPPALLTPRASDTRPFDLLGTPADPLPFERAAIQKGRRDAVLCYNPQTEQHEILHDVLFRDCNRELELNGVDNLTQAYWPIPYKEKVKTIMGHVEFCVVLERCRRQRDDTDDDGSSDDDEEEEDIVFQLTNRRVAVKVCYYDKMERLRNRHAEDPRKEVAAMQLVGDDHPHVLGCREVLFDGNNLCIVMHFCDSGDLFQLLHESPHRDDESPGLSEAQARYWFRQIMAGVQFLHSKGVCHRDL